MRILISGITSFLGISTGKALLKKGHEVYGILRPESRNKERLKGEKGMQLLSLNMESFLLWEKEEGREAESLNPASLSAFHFDTVLHFAWDGVGSLGRSDLVTQEKNLAMSKAFFSWAKAQGVKRFFFAGSQAEMGRGTREEPLPASPYGEKKLAFSEYGLKNHGDMEFIDLRIYSIYGKGDHERSLVKTLVRNTLRGTETELGSGNKIWNFMAEEDFGRALAFLVNLDFQKRGAFTIDICSRESRLLSDYIKEIERIGFSFLKKKGIEHSEESLLHFGVRPPNVEGDYDFTAHTKELSALGFEEQISFSSGIEELYEFIYEEEFLKA